MLTFQSKSSGLGILSDISANAGNFDQFNDWDANLREGFNTSYPSSFTSVVTPLQLCPNFEPEYGLHID